jgi:hypothetical protein
MDKKIRSPTCPSQRKKKERKKMNKKRNKEKQGEKGIDSLFPPLRGLNPPIPFAQLLLTQLAGSIQPSFSLSIAKAFHLSAEARKMNLLKLMCEAQKLNIFIIHSLSKIGRASCRERVCNSV